VFFTLKKWSLANSSNSNNNSVFESPNILLYLSYNTIITFDIWDHSKYFKFSIALPCTLNSKQCQNNGKCLEDNKGGFTCTCEKGYTGVNCETGNAFF
jgi:hypothetical protein